MILTKFKINKNNNNNNEAKCLHILNRKSKLINYISLNFTFSTIFSKN